MRRSGRIVRQVLEAAREVVAPGVSTMDLERVAERKIRDLGAKPAFKGYYDYPCVLCTSVNDEIVHGIPSERRVLKAGDIVSLDCGVVLDGYYGDSAITVPVGDEISAGATEAPGGDPRVAVPAASRRRAPVIPSAMSGRRCSSIVEANGFSVVREFVGHGIGTRLHEDPQVPNYGTPGHGPKLRDGMVLAIEPMVNMGKAGNAAAGRQVDCGDRRRQL